NYHKKLLNLDCVVLPYSPINYCRRISGILIQAALYSVPSIVSSGTNLEDEIIKEHAAGIIFDYDVSSEIKTVNNIVNAIIMFKKQRKLIQSSAKKLSYYFLNESVPDKFIKKILNYYG
ncbi:MAG: hypothetical protein COU26_01145, partial [Candidatus Levybacteria bacterium CG10_big_fil_rev_8_21_14_0_10_36_30]